MCISLPFKKNNKSDHRSGFFLCKQEWIRATGGRHLHDRCRFFCPNRLKASPDTCLCMMRAMQARQPKKQEGAPVFLDGSGTRSSVRHDFLQMGLQRIDPDGEPQTLTGLNNEGVQSHNLTMQIDQRAAAVTRIDGSVGLQNFLIYSFRDLNPSVFGTNDTRRDGVFQT